MPLANRPASLVPSLGSLGDAQRRAAKGTGPMAIPTIRYTTSLDGIWEDLTYTEARLTHDSRAADLALIFADLIDRTTKVRAKQYEKWRGEIVAQALVDARDIDLDIVVGDFARALLLACSDSRQSAQFQRYFPAAPSTIIRLGLRAEIDRIRTWPESLRTEDDATLKVFSKKFEKAITGGNEALETRDNAIAASADHRVREIVTLIDDCNAARISVYGELLKRGAKHKALRTWADGFFRHNSRSEPQESPTPEEPV